MDLGRQTYIEMVIAIILQLIFYAVIGTILCREMVLFPISVVIGGSIAIGILRNMLRSIEIVLDLDPETAKKYGRRQAIVRIAIMGLSLCIAFYFREYVNPWGVLIGVFSLKFSAYISSFVYS